jgi:hypothetical protein
MQNDVVVVVLNQLACGQIGMFVKQLKKASDSFRLYAVECVNTKNSMASWLR